MAVQTSVILDPAVAVPGLIADAGNRYVITRINQVIAQIVTVTIAVVANTFEYYMYINGVKLAYTSDGTATEAEINAGMLAAINDSVFNGPAPLPFDVTAVQGATTATFIVTADVGGVGYTHSVVATNLTEAVTAENSGDIPFGVGVVQGSTADICRLPTGSGDTLLGIAVLDQTEPNQIRTGENEYQGGDTVGIMEQGRVWVAVEDAVVVGGNVYIRYASSANGSQLGAVRSDADSSSAAQLTAAVFATAQATPGGYAVVSVNKP